jgi:AraC-like DNA-binding protein
MTPAHVEYTFENPWLGELVSSAWGQSYADPTAKLPGLIAPDAHVEVVFQLGAPCALATGAFDHQTPRAMIYGLRHGALQLCSTGPNVMVAFRMPPAVASVVLQSRLVECWDQPIALADIIGAEADDLLDRIARVPFASAGPVVEHWLVSRLTDWSEDDDRQRRLQAALLWDFAGEPVSALADQLGFTDRTLRRHCETHAGLSPKQLVMSGRMLRACDLLRRSPVSLAEAALRLGFSDQAAFTNAFRHYLGMTPAQLRAEAIVHYQMAR